jgi:PPK2 family polyphosphate:nucleotide phosphotransferase
MRDMFKAVDDPYLVPYDGSFRVKLAPTRPPSDSGEKKKNRKRLKKLRRHLRSLQRVIYADDSYSVLLIFQAMDAAGKDGTIRAVLTGVNPAGCQVFSFKRPSAEELDHDFIWRTYMRLPERGRIGVFNRSYYEEVLVVRVHPELLAKQRIPSDVDPKRIWKERYESIAATEKHLAQNGLVILKFWLNVSKEEQRQRFLARIDEPEKNWKFSKSDVEERAYWADYMKAYQESLNATSRPWAPWYAIPADDKPFMRAKVAEIIVRNLELLDLAYPEVSKSTRKQLQEMRSLLD